MTGWVVQGETPAGTAGAIFGGDPPEGYSCAILNAVGRIASQHAGEPVGWYCIYTAMLGGGAGAKSLGRQAFRPNAAHREPWYGTFVKTAIARLGEGGRDTLAATFFTRRRRAGASAFGAGSATTNTG